MYAVIKTGGKQYRVQAGDVLVVEKLAGDVGAVVGFNEVLMVGEGADVMVGAPLVDGAVVTATLIETRKGEKVKIFKKIRRQGYRRTKGHRQEESVLRVTSVNPGGKGKEDKWDGTVNLTPLSVLNLRARNLANAADATLAKAEAAAKKYATSLAKARKDEDRTQRDLTAAQVAVDRDAKLYEQALAQERLNNTRRRRRTKKNPRPAPRVV